MMRPRPARWFEALVARDDASRALAALAATGAVELEARSGAVVPSDFAELRRLLQAHGELAQRYRAYWPSDGLQPSPYPEPPLQALRRGLQQLRDWAVEAEPLIRTLQAAMAEQDDLACWRAVVAHPDAAAIDLGHAAAAGPTVRACLFVWPAGAEPAPSPALLRSFDAGTQRAAIALGTPAALQALAQELAALKGRRIAVPEGLGGDATANAAELDRRLVAAQVRVARARTDLAALADRHGLRRALADAGRLQWMLDNVRVLEAGDWLCWLTGWTSAGDVTTLERALAGSGARALVHLAPPPPGLQAPLLLANPPWVRPFEVFARALGMPAGNEADPSLLLALAVPLMFGYMFGDVGQGLVIAAGGFVLRRRWPMARLFIAGGLSAVVFGLLFGSVFSLHLWPALWLAPLDDPLTVLMVPLAGGALLLCGGLLLAALQAHWRGEFGHWLATDAGLLGSYLGLLLAPWWPATLWLALAGALWFCAGHGWRERRWLAAAAALGEWVERLLQILINTLSFARVGAFALAHAGLSSAIAALMHAAGHPLAAAAVLVLGNVVVIVLEGLVVSIQTTRLVLFEFFARFLDAQGRVFRPLPPPPLPLQETLS